MQPLQSLQLCNKSNICRRSASVFVGNHARLPPAVAQPKAATHHARSSQGGWSSQGRLGRQVLRTSCAPSAAHSTLAASSRPIRAMLFRKPAECFGFACGNCSSTVTSAALSFTPNGRSSNMRGPTLCSRCSLSPTIPRISPRSLRAPQTLCHNSNFTQNMESLLRTSVAVTTHRVVSTPPAAASHHRPPDAASTYSRLVSLATIEGNAVVCAFRCSTFSLTCSALTLCISRMQEPRGALCSLVAVFGQLCSRFNRRTHALRTPVGLPPSQACGAGTVLVLCTRSAFRHTCLDRCLQ